MIDKLKDIHSGATIAVIGSGATAEKYSAKEDIAIVLNGAINISQPFHYFQAFDTGLHRKPWFYYSKDAVRIIGAGLAPMDEMLFPDLPTHLRKKIPKASLSEERYKAIMGDRFPAPPHHLFFYETRNFPSYGGKIKDLKILSSARNIASCALETAVIMGATEIHIYGIGMSHRRYFNDDSGKGNYSVAAGKYFNQLIDRIEEEGVKVLVCREEDGRVTSGGKLC